MAEIKLRWNLDLQLRLERPAGSGATLLGVPGVTHWTHQGIPSVAASAQDLSPHTALPSKPAPALANRTRPTDVNKVNGVRQQRPGGPCVFYWK